MNFPCHWTMNHTCLVSVYSLGDFIFHFLFFVYFNCALFSIEEESILERGNGFRLKRKLEWDGLLFSGLNTLRIEQWIVVANNDEQIHLIFLFFFWIISWLFAWVFISYLILIFVVIHCFVLLFVLVGRRLLSNASLVQCLSASYYL